MVPAVTTPRLKLDAAVENQTGLPLRPSNVNVTNLQGVSLTVNWSDNSLSEASFRVTVNPVNTLLPWRGAVTGVNATSANITGLTPNSGYVITVQACNAASQCSALTPGLSVTTRNTLPSTPVNFRAGTVTTSALEVRWESNSVNPVTSFRLRGTGNASGQWLTQTLAANVRSYTYGNLQPNSGYNFVIQACNADGCSPDSPILHVVTQSAGSPPAAPTNLHVCGTTLLEACLANSTFVAWRDNATNEDGYVFEFAIAQANVPFNQMSWSVFPLGPNRTGYSFTPPLTPGRIYYFRVRAYNVAGSSAYSNTVMYTP
jgi:titin